jgi:flagellar hook-basal body complex protein FliE
MSSIIGAAALLQAQSAYTTTNVAPNANMTSAASVENAANFQKMVAKNFDNFSNMKPEQILAVMKQAREVSGVQNTQNTQHTNSITSLVGSLSNSIKHDEDVKKRAIIGEASLSEVISATSEAKTTLQTTIAARNKVIEMWNQIMNMPI